MNNTFTMEVTTENEVLTIGVEIDQTEIQVCKNIKTHVQGIIEAYKRTGTLPNNTDITVLKTLVNTFNAMLNAMADSYGADTVGQLYVDTLGTLREEFEEVLNEIENA